MHTLQQNVYQHLIRTTAKWVSWSTVEGVSLNQLHSQVLKTRQKAEQVGLSLEDIRLALQIGEYEGKFGS